MSDESGEENCRPATLADLKTLIHSLNEQKADYLLIGGYALFTQGFQRATTDIDLLVPATQDSGSRVKKALLVLPDKAASDIELEWFEEGENIRVLDSIAVDLILSTCGETYESLKKYSQIVYLEEVPIMTVTLDGLLRTKQSVREKDVMDRKVIEGALALLRMDPENEAGKKKPNGW